MNAYCPLIKENCKSNECMAWKDKKCLIISFLESSIDNHIQNSNDFDGHESEFGVDPRSKVHGDLPAEIASLTPEELANELVDFVKNKCTHNEEMSVSFEAMDFWDQKKLTEWGFHPDFEQKIHKAERLAQQRLDKEREEAEKQQLAQMIERCVTWAQRKNFTKLSRADVDAFMYEENIEILPKMKRALYATANVELKKK